MKKTSSFNSLKTTALIALLTGALGSLYFVVIAGRNNSSILLPALFVIWVLSPFMALLIINSLSKRWSFLTGQSIYWLMLIITIGSIVLYSVYNTPGTKRTFIFLIVPLISWLLVIVMLVTLKLSRKTKGTSQDSNIHL